MPEPDPGRAGTSSTIATAMQNWTTQLARAGIEEAGGDIRRLVAGALGFSGADLLRMPERVLTAAELELLHRHVERRRKREPVSRILGERDFYGRTFAVSPATLDPRPDSETVISTALEVVREEGWQSQPLRVLDFGTGSGCLLLTLLCELPQATGLGSDISGAALEAASHNARRLGVAPRAAWLQADGLENVRGTFQLLVANPPYVRTGDIPGLEPEVRDFDPVEALDGGADGLTLYRRLVPGIVKLVPDGWIVLEVGHDQADAVADLLASETADINAARIRIRHDVAGKRRCVATRTLG